MVRRKIKRLARALKTDRFFRIPPHDSEFSNAMEAAESFMARYRNALRELAR